jgi:hypothetical protein
MRMCRRITVAAQYAQLTVLPHLHSLQQPPLMLLDGCILLGHTLLQPPHALLQGLKLLQAAHVPYCSHSD